MTGITRLLNVALFPGSLQNIGESLGHSVSMTASTPVPTQCSVVCFLFFRFFLMKTTKAGWREAL